MGCFFISFLFKLVFLNSFKEENECGAGYKRAEDYALIAGKIAHVQNNDTIYRLGFKLDKYKTKCLTCRSGDSLVYVKFSTLSNRYDIRADDSLYIYSDSDIFRISIYRNGELRPKLALY